MNNKNIFLFTPNKNTTKSIIQVNTFIRIKIANYIINQSLLRLYIQKTNCVRNIMYYLAAYLEDGIPRPPTEVLSI